MPNHLTSAQQTFLNHLEFLSTKRIDDWMNLFSPTGVLEFPYAPPGYPTRLTGHNELRAYIHDFMTGFDVAFDEVVFHETIDATLVIAELRGHGASLTTGAPYEQVYISVVRTTDSLITHYSDYWNPLAFSQASEPDPGSGTV